MITWEIYRVDYEYKKLNLGLKYITVWHVKCVSRKTSGRGGYGYTIHKVVVMTRMVMVQ